MGRSVASSKLRRVTSKKQKKGRKSWKKTQSLEVKIQAMDEVDLNDDCLSEIFGYLIISDLLHVAAACARFNFVARDVFARTFAKHVVTVTNEYTTTGQVPSVLLLSHFGDLITKLRVDYTHRSRFDYELEDAISEYCRNSLIEVEFECCSHFAFIRIERSLESVSKVRLTECQMGSLITKFNQLFPKARCLEYQRMPKFRADIQQNLQQLKHLGFINPIVTFYCSWRDTNALRGDIMAAINLIPQLTSLTIKCGRFRLTGADLSIINEKLPLLDTLDITIDSSYLERRIHFQNVQKLTIVNVCSSSTSLVSNFRITTHRPAALTLIGKWLSRDLGKFLSTNRNWVKISLHGLWWSNRAYERMKNEITKLKLLTSMEMSANGLKGKENDVLALLDQCKSLRKLKVYSGHFFGALIKFNEFTSDLSGEARHNVLSYGETRATGWSDDDTFLKVYRSEFDLKFKDSDWLPKLEAKKEEKGNYSWTELSAVFKKRDFNE